MFMPCLAPFSIADWLVALNALFILSEQFFMSDTSLTLKVKFMLLAPEIELFTGSTSCTTGAIPATVMFKMPFTDAFSRFTVLPWHSAYIVAFDAVLFPEFTALAVVFHVVVL